MLTLGGLLLLLRQRRSRGPETVLSSTPASSTQATTAGA
ncbi:MULTISPECIES: hypothetical protein [unclassified Roseateles]